ncbi:MAG: hypothetical protein IJ424_03695 [Oscillospiraceae bacterium]|nr:hypothetical protein [Oscillospiraceae bacterium]
MTALYITLGIIAGIILIIYILLRISVCAYVDATNEHLRVKVKYICFELYKFEKEFKSTADNPAFELVDLDEADDIGSKQKQESSAPKAKPSEKKKNEDTADASDMTDEELLKGESSETEEKPKKSVKEILDEYLPYVPVAKKALKKLLKLIRFYNLDLIVTIGDNDAYEAAMKFGKFNILIYSSLALLCTAFSVNIKHTEVKCDFENPQTQASLNTIVKVRPSAVLALAVYLGINYLKLRHNQKKKEKRLNKEKENSNV